MDIVKAINAVYSIESMENAGRNTPCFQTPKNSLVKSSIDKIHLEQLEQQLLEHSDDLDKSTEVMLILDNIRKNAKNSQSGDLYYIKTQSDSNNESNIKI